MRINIIGTSGSGKTTLAKKLSKEKDINHYNLDYILYDQKPGVRGRTERNPKELSKLLQKITNQKDWIIEGVNPIPEVFEKADKIIWLKPSIATALFRQWKRFMTDETQRKEHGFINNLKLSRYIIKQHYEDIPEKDNDFKFVRVKKLERILKTYRNKLEKI